jgi:hypothetical protein
MPVRVIIVVYTQKHKRGICHKMIICRVAISPVRGIDWHRYMNIFFPGSVKDPGQNNDADYNDKH